MAEISSPSPFPSREQKREAVLRAAVRMFNARGFHATSLDDVAASLRISKPTIYYYLGNKEEVLLECMARGLSQLRDVGEEARQAPGSGLDRLRTFLHRYAEVILDDFGRCVIRTPEEVLSPEGIQRFRGLKAEIDRMMRSLIDEAKDDGSIAPMDTKLAAFALAGALNWPARWHDPQGELDPDAVATQMVDILVSGIAPR
jgi:AcrR family transcriptional regulator